MLFTVRTNTHAACLCFVMLTTLALLSLHGCASGPQDSMGTGPATTKSTTKAPTRPIPETITVELNSDVGPFAPRARGLLRPKAPTLPPDLLAALGVLAHGTHDGPPPILVTLGDSVKFDGAFPGDKGIWTKWDQGVEALVRQQQSEGGPVVYEVWKEPDDNKTFKDRLNFFGAWVHTTRNIRRLAPDAVLMGPSTLKFDHGWISEFLKVCKEYSVLPNIVGWHEDGLKHDLSGHIGSLADSFWQDGTNIKHLVISSNASIDNKQSPGDPVIFLAQMEKSFKDNSFRRIEQEFGFKLTHLFTNDSKPRSLYYAYRDYARLAGAGRTVKVSASQTVEGLAVWSGSSRKAEVLLGRNRSRVDAKQVLGLVTLQIKGARGTTVQVRLSHIADSGGQASTGPTPAFDQDYAIKNGEASIPLPEFASGDAYSIELTIVGDPPSTRAATAPATKTAPSSSNKTDSAK